MSRKKNGWFQRFLLFTSLRSQLLSRSLFILSGLLLLIGLLQFVFMKQFLIENRAFSIKDQMKNIPNEIWQHEIEDAITDNSEDARVLFPDVTMAFIDMDGTFFPFSKDIYPEPAPKLTKQEYLDALPDSRKVTYKVINDSKGSGTLIILKPISTQSGLKGIIQIGSSTKPLRDILFRQMFIYLALSIMALVVGLLTFLPVLKRTLIPLLDIVNKVEQINAGNLNVRLPSPVMPLEIKRLSASFNDMLERLEASFKAEKEAKEQMRRFIADASHELRTPLTSIHGFLEILMRGAADRPDQLHKALNSMYGESERVNKLVESLLLLAKIDRLPPFQMEEKSVGDLLLEMEPQLRLLGGERTVNFSITSDVKARMDQDKIKQVILNLFQNAVQHTDPKIGVITVSLEKDLNGVLLIVEDNGQGISEEHLPYLFERFYRIESSRSRKYGGAGLGLAITKSIIDFHGGSIQVNSKIGEMTTFRVWLPGSK